MVQDLRSHFIYYFSEPDGVLRERFYNRVIYIELEKIIKSVLLNCGVFPEGIGCLMYENFKQDIYLKIYETITKGSIQNITNINGYIFSFGKNYCLNELKRANKLKWIKEQLTKCNSHESFN